MLLRLSLLPLICTPVCVLDWAAVVPAAAQAAAPDALLPRVQRVQASASKREHFSVPFKQEFFSALSKKIRKSEGVLEFAAPRNFRWEVTFPNRELYVNDGKDFWKYTESLRHAQRLAPSGMELNFVDLVLNLSSLTERYDVAAWKESPAKPSAQAPDAVRSDEPPVVGNGTLLLALTPKSEGAQKRIFLRVDEAKANVRELRIVYANGNRTRIAFESLKDEKVDPKRFTFTPPPGTAVDKM